MLRFKSYKPPKRGDVFDGVLKEKNVEKHTEKLFDADAEGEKIADVVESDIGGKVIIEEKVVEEGRDQTFTALCGRIRFENTPIEPEAPKDLVCEECEKIYAVLCCEACSQVYCARCADLCHRIEVRGEAMHPHEKDGFLRPLVMGDSSKIKENKEFVMPSMDLFEHEYSQVKDLTKPKTLSVDSRFNPERTSQPFVGPKFMNDEILLFIDPATHDESYGRVISEWDYRHGNLAPAIARGEKSGIYYVMEMKGFVADIGNVNTLVKQMKYKPPDPVFPKLEGLLDAPNRSDLYNAAVVNQRISDAHELQQYGPIHHFRESSSIFMIDTEGTKSEGSDASHSEKREKASIVGARTTGQLNLPAQELRDDEMVSFEGSATESLLGSFRGSPVSAMPMPSIGNQPKGGGDVAAVTAPSTARQRRNIPEARPRKGAAATAGGTGIGTTMEAGTDTWVDVGVWSGGSEKGGPPATALGMDQRKVLSRELLLQQRFEQQQHQRATHHDKANWPPYMATYDPEFDSAIDIVRMAKSMERVSHISKHASERKPYDGVSGHSTNAERMQNILILGEQELCRPTDRQALLNNEKFDFMKKFLKKRFFSLFTKMVKRGFKIWRANMAHLRAMQREYCAQRIQAAVRMWLCRDVIKILLANRAYKIRRKWEIIHEMFNYCTKDTPNCVTMDQVLYFETVTDANRYAAFLRRMVMRVARVVDRKRRDLLRLFLRRWKGNVQEFNEADIKVGHFQHWAVDLEVDEEVLTVEQEQERALALQVLLKEEGLEAIGTDLLADENVMTMPLGLTRTILPPAPSYKFALKTGTTGGSPAGGVSPAPKPTASNSGTPQTLGAAVAGGATGATSATSGSGGGASKKFPGGGAVVVFPPIAGAAARPASQPEFDGRRVGLSSAMRAGIGGNDDASSVSSTSSGAAGAQEEVDLPPWHPSIGIKLPKLHALLTPKTAEERLNCPSEMRLLKYSFRAYTEGPSDHSSWVIPDRVVMGAVPFGRARKKEPLSVLHAMMFSGIDTFVSLMEEEEEAAFFREQGCQDSVPMQLKAAFASAKFANDNIILENTDIVFEMIGVLKKIPTFLKVDVRYEEAHKEEVKAKARMKRAKDAIHRAKSQLKKIPRRYDWLRIPLQSDTVPGINELIPQLWELEKRLARGESLYIYSKDGHGRAGMIAGCLVGRLYGLNPLDALYRIQACHDSARGETGRAVAITCPQLPAQRALMSQVLTHTNRAWVGTHIRTMMDPDSHIEEFHYLPRGANTGVDMATCVRDDPRQRDKDSVHFEKNIVRDTFVPPSNEIGRDGADELNLQELYDKKKLGQTKDVVRALPLKRQVPTPAPTGMPLLRVATKSYVQPR